MTTFIPRRITACASKAGKTYWKIETDQGEATCFDYPIVQELEKSIGKPISIYDLEKNEKGFINIRPARSKPQQAQGSTQIASAMPQQAPISDNFKEARIAKDVSIYTSYAKDVFIELLKADKSESLKASEIMNSAIALIKQAKTSFERTEVFEQANPKVNATLQG